jgi:hypothetical protein
VKEKEKKRRENGKDKRIGVISKLKIAKATQQYRISNAAVTLSWQARGDRDKGFR